MLFNMLYVLDSYRSHKEELFRRNPLLALLRGSLQGRNLGLDRLRELFPQFH